MAKETAQPNGLQILKKAIKDKNIGRLYFFYGEETFLLNYYLEQLRKMLVDPLTESFNYHKLTNENFDIRAFADAVENLPMMAENTLVWVDEIDPFKLNESDRTKIAELLSDIPEYCTVVFTYVTTQWKPDKRFKKLWDAVSQYGQEVDFARQEHRDLIVWITRHFAANQKQISQELCSYLIDITGGTMTALAGEISKICAYSGSDRITKSDIDAVTEPVLDAVVFQMTDLMSEGAYGAAMMKLQHLFKMQQKPLAILGAVGGHFRRLGAARTLLDAGKNAIDLARICGIGEYPAKKTMAAAKRFSQAYCQKAMEWLLEADYQMKTSFDEPERILELLILRLSQEARNG